MPASSTYFDDQCTILKQLDAWKVAGINIKGFLKSAEAPIKALFQGKQFQILDLHNLLTCLSQHTTGINPTFTNKCTSYEELLRTMDHKH